MIGCGLIFSPKRRKVYEDDIIGIIANGNQIRFKPANPVKSRRKAHCLQTVYNQF